jgi:cell fate (sporulation/competence/biofilm development) regulator YlbF (YheA/YmcA/DUF963 family)
LAVIGNELRITIPENWLSEAKYPVVVDPTIGTIAVGSQYRWRPEPGDPLQQLMFEGEIPVNRFLVADTINGTCTAYMYSYIDNYGENGGYPVLYSDNGDKPQTIRTLNSLFADFTVKSGKPAGWRSSTFMTISAISSGTYIWFGVFVDFFWETRFDYGAKCYRDKWYEVGNSIPSTYPIFNVNWYENLILSMYFSYNAAGQNYKRTLTQGVTLSDNRIITGNYKRITTQTVQADTTAKKQISIFKRIQETLKGFDQNTFSFFRLSKIQEAINITDNISHLKTIIRRLLDTAGVEGEAKAGRVFFRSLADTVHAVGILFRGMVLFTRIVTRVFVTDYLISRFLKSKTEIALKSCVTREISIESKIN